MTRSYQLRKTLPAAIYFAAIFGACVIPFNSVAQEPSNQQQRAAMERAAKAKKLTNPTTGGAFLSSTDDTARNTLPPKRVFTGCDMPESKGNGAASPRTRITNKRDDVIKQRTFAGSSLDEIEASDISDDALECWFRIDGVWRQESVITLDKTKTPTEWHSKEPDILTLANGNYTTPIYLFIETFEGTDDKIAVRSAMDDDNPIVLTSNDGVLLKDALTRNGPRKVYNFSGPNASGKTQFTIRMTRIGRIQLSYAGQKFVRPKPGVSRTASEDQIRSDDAFILSYNLKNLKANRQGYDVVTQDAFRLLDSDKLPVFAEVSPTQYKISEQQIVPVGMTLIQENTQGTIYAKSLITSEIEYQKVSGHSFGASVDVSASKERKRSGGVSNSKSGSTSIGFNYTKEQTEGMRGSNAEMQAMGFSRSKRYAMVVDHPFVTLSDSFIEAIDDALFTGNYAAVIDHFGTHYAYAVTYGSVGKLTQRFTRNEIADYMSSNSGKSFNAVVSVSNYENELRNSNTTQENENWTFVALGGNGSWDQSGFATGDTPYPILLDLRPLEELLNPMNFPGEPEVYERARAGLRAAIEHYMDGKRSLLSEESMLPKVETWDLTVTQLVCGSAGTEVDNILDLAGNLLLQTLAQPKGGSFHPKKYLFSRNKNKHGARILKCPKGRFGLNYTKRFHGTRQQLNQYRFRMRSELLELDYAGAFDPDDQIRGNSPTFRVPPSSTPVGKTVRGSWRLPPGPENTHLGLHWYFKRVK